MPFASFHRASSAILCTLVLAAGAACSNAEVTSTMPDGSAGNPPDSAAPDAAVAEDASEALRAAQPWIDAHCRVARTCCERAGFDLQPLEMCELAAVDQVPFLDAVAAGTAIVDPASVESCAAALERLADSCTYPESTLGECSTLWAGTRGEGEQCASVAECARMSDPVVCLKIADAVGRPETGTCVTMQRGALGGECVGSSYEGYYGATYTAAIVQQALVYCDAADGLYCDFGTYTCVPYATEGQTCGSVQCALGLYCDAAVCRVRSSAGASCSSLDACALPLLCENGVCTEPPVASSALCSGDFG